MTGGPHPPGWHPRVPTGAYLIFMYNAILHFKYNITAYLYPGVLQSVVNWVYLAWISTRHSGYEYFSSAGAFMNHLSLSRFGVTLTSPLLITFVLRSWWFRLFYSVSVFFYFHHWSLPFMFSILDHVRLNFTNFIVSFYHFFPLLQLYQFISLVSSCQFYHLIFISSTSLTPFIHLI